MANVKGLVFVVLQLREQRTNLLNKVKHVDAALSVLSKLNGGKIYTEPRRTLSASARKRIAVAQKLRRARVRSQKVISIAKSPEPGKRTMSAPVRRKIAARNVQDGRW